MGSLATRMRLLWHRQMKMGVRWDYACDLKYRVVRDHQPRGQGEYYRKFEKGTHRRGTIRRDNWRLSRFWISISSDYDNHSLILKIEPSIQAEAA